MRRPRKTTARTIINREKQVFVAVKIYDPTKTRRSIMMVSAYGQQWSIGSVKHGDEARCPLPAVDNKTIFKLADYPKLTELKTDAESN